MSQKVALSIKSLLYGSIVNEYKNIVQLENLSQTASSLLSTGVGALGWQAISHSTLRDLPFAHELHQAYRLHTLQAAVRERELSQ